MTSPALAPEEYRWTDPKIYESANKIIELKKTKGPWEVIEFILKMWRETNPKEYNSFVFSLDKIKSSRKITSIGGKQYSGVSKDAHGSYLQYKLDIPEKVVYLIRRVYTPTELPMNKEFYDAWAKKFPSMVIMERV